MYIHLYRMTWDRRLWSHLRYEFQSIEKYAFIWSDLLYIWVIHTTHDYIRITETIEMPIRNILNVTALFFKAKQIVTFSFYSVAVTILLI